MTFKPGHKKIPGSGMQPGQKTAKVEAWERIGEYVIGEGADRYLKIMQEMPDKEFTKEFQAIIEYFHPKLQRSEIKAEFSDLNSKIDTIYDALQQEPDIPESKPE